MGSANSEDINSILLCIWHKGDNNRAGRGPGTGRKKRAGKRRPAVQALAWFLCLFKKEEATMQHLGLLKPRLGFWNIDLNAVCTLRSGVLPERGCPLSSHEASSSFLALSVGQIQRLLSGDGEFSFRGLLWYRRRNLSLFLRCRGGKKK